MKNTIIMVLIAVVFAGAGFWGGMQYQKGKAPTFAGFAGAADTFARGNGQGAAGARRGGGGTGQVISADAKSVTFKLSNGSTEVAYLSDTTAVNVEQKGAVTDIAAGKQIQVTGTPNSDGSISATTVRLLTQ